MFTSNIDGHFVDTFGEEAVLECHGALTHLQCVRPEACSNSTWPTPKDLDGLKFSEDEKNDYIGGVSAKCKAPLPTCKNCNGQRL